jgi:hypothetical protein
MQSLSAALSELYVEVYFSTYTEVPSQNPRSSIVQGPTRDPQFFFVLPDDMSPTSAFVDTPATGLHTLEQQVDPLRCSS